MSASDITSLFSTLPAEGEGSLLEMYKSDLKIAREQIARLEEEVADLRRKLFGTQSEKYGQLPEALIEEVEETTAPKPPKPDTPKPKGDGAGEEGPAKRKRKLKLTNIRTRVVRLIPQEVLDHPELYELMDEEQVRCSCRLEHIPAHLRMLIFECPAYVRRGSRGKGKDCAPLRATPPAAPMKGSIMGASILARCVYAKFLQHLPLYRQIKDFERLGLHNVSEGNLCHWAACAANLLEPLWREMHEQVMQSLCLHADETPVRRLKGRNKKGYMWLATSADDGKSFYMWSETRGAETSDRLLRHGMKEDGDAYDGILVTDGYVGYDAWVQGLPEERRPLRQMCWAHVRRKFFECANKSQDPEWCAEIVRMIAPLYGLEKELRESNAPPAKIVQSRKAQSAPLVAEIFEKIKARATDPEKPPRDKLKKAIEYALKRQAMLTTWLEEAHIPIDNNRVERAVRPVAVGRRNWLFLGSDAGGERAAILYTMLQECERCKVDALAWLTRVLEILPSYRGNYADLMPGKLELPATTSKQL